MSRRALILVARAITYLAGAAVLAWAGAGATAIGRLVVVAYVARGGWSILRLIRPTRPLFADALVDVLAPTLTGVFIGHDPSSLHLLVAAQVAASFLVAAPRRAGIVGAVGTAGIVAGLVADRLAPPAPLTLDGYVIAEQGAIVMGLMLGSIVLFGMSRHMWRLNQRLAKAAATERENAVLQQRFMSMVNHELRTPLTGIRGFAELLRESGADLSREDAIEFVDAIWTQSGHLSRLVDDVLVVLRLEAGGLPVSLQPVDAGAVARAVAGAVSVPTDRELTMDLPELLWVRADPDRLFQVLRNLVENAVKYGGRRISVGGAAAGDRSRIEVSDDGEGIPDDRLEDAFSEFVQLTAADSGRGFGLGLSIVRHLVGAQGGTLSYRKGPLGGACFSVDLPTESPPAP
ncbi:MAG TPA: HAMP domain-containing sensor histidine kinase [Acidimicrobiia bacterium]